jgi:hypothetical protein
MRLKICPNVRAEGLKILCWCVFSLKLLNFMMRDEYNKCGFPAE